jgi:hypothetical protein
MTENNTQTHNQAQPQGNRKVKQHFKTPDLTVGELLQFDSTMVHQIQTGPKLSFFRPALRMNSDRQLVPNTERVGHLIFLEDYFDGASSCSITERSGRVSKAKVVALPIA